MPAMKGCATSMSSLATIDVIADYKSHRNAASALGGFFSAVTVLFAAALFSWLLYANSTSRSPVASSNMTQGQVSDMPLRCTASLGCLVVFAYEWSPCAGALQDRSAVHLSDGEVVDVPICGSTLPLDGTRVTTYIDLLNVTSIWGGELFGATHQGALSLGTVEAGSASFVRVHRTRTTNDLDSLPPEDVWTLAPGAYTAMADAFCVDWQRGRSWNLACSTYIVQPAAYFNYVHMDRKDGYVGVLGSTAAIVQFVFSTFACIKRAYRARARAQDPEFFNIEPDMSRKCNSARKPVQGDVLAMASVSTMEGDAGKEGSCTHVSPATLSLLPE